MVLSNEKKSKYAKRLILSRMRVLINNGFYGLLLMHLGFSLDDKCSTAATDGKKIYFNPGFLDELSDPELDLVLMHEVLHVVLQHCFRRGDRDRERFDTACEIVVNSNILLSNDMDLSSITLKKYGELIHTTPDGREGYDYTAEQVYEKLMLLPVSEDKTDKPGESLGDDIEGEDDDTDNDGKGGSFSTSGKGYNNNEKDDQQGFDEHNRWGSEDIDESLRDRWLKHLEDACESISIRDPSNQRGLIPKCAERLLKELRKPQTDWRTILNEFVQEEITDYSFAPPDRRFDDSPFFLPDFNEKDDSFKDILFMIDTSGSMSDDMITAAFSEIKGAIDQFNGKLKGWLGFFDAKVVEPVAFETIEEFKIIRPKGGGGTDFEIILKYVQEHMSENLPVSIIILTDGYAPFPDEKMTMGIPVLWLLNNEEVEPPWGKVARITV